MPKVTLHQEKRPTKNAPNRQKWVLRWFDSHGKRRGEIIGEVGKMSRRDAESNRRTKQGGMHHGIVKVDNPKKLTLSKFAELDREVIESDVKSSTLAEYENAAKHAVEALGTECLLSSIGWREVGKIKQHLSRQGLSTATIRKTIGTLRAMFNRAVRHGLLTSNPFAQQRMPKVQAKQMRIFSREEVSCMVESTDDLWWKAFIQLAVTSGLRKAELLNLMWRDIDFEEQTVTVSAKRTGAFKLGEESYPILEWSSKSHQQRTVPIPEETNVLLRRLQVKAGGSLYVFLKLERLKVIQNHFVDGKLSARFNLINNMGRDFRVIQGRARWLLARQKGVSVVKVDWPIGCIHDLRRTYGTWMAKVVPMHELKVYMGHQSISTTAAFYLAVSADSAERVREALAVTSTT